MKKTISLFMLLALLATVFVCAPRTASAGTSVTLADSVSYSAGITTITWTVEGDALSSYFVIGEALGGDVEQQRVRLGETSVPSLTTPEFIPGKSYRVYVTDSEFHMLDSKEYTMPEPVTFEDGKLKNTSVKITAEPVKLAANADGTALIVNGRAFRLPAGMFAPDFIPTASPEEASAVSGTSAPASAARVSASVSR